TRPSAGRWVQALARPAPAAAAVIASSPAPAPTGLPKVASFELPVDELAQVAEGSGLQWVGSNAEKIAAVQAAIAAEPKPVRVPRERPPAVVIADEPLVLVETKRDLSQLKLPIDAS
ncbi:MAG: ribonuclease E/G, partial [Comamonadaceae bacterium]